MIRAVTAGLLAAAVALLAGEGTACRARVGPPPAPERRQLTPSAVFHSADAKAGTVRVGLIGTNHRGEVVLSEHAWRVAADLKVLGRDGRPLKLSDIKKGTPVWVTVGTKLLKEKEGRRTVLRTVMTGPVVEIEVAGPDDFPTPPAKGKRGEGRK